MKEYITNTSPGIIIAECNAYSASPSKIYKSKKSIKAYKIKFKYTFISYYFLFKSLNSSKEVEIAILTATLWYSP